MVRPIVVAFLVSARVLTLQCAANDLLDHGQHANKQSNHEYSIFCGSDVPTRAVTSYC